MAASQHGVVSRHQLLALGFSSQAIKTLVGRDRLHRLHRGVYALGDQRLTAKGRWMAAVLACGPGAVLSYAEAAALHDLRRVPSGKINVTAPTRHNLPARLIDALEAAQRQNKLDVGAIDAVIARNPGRHGFAPLRTAIAELTDEAPRLQSGLERAFRHLIRTHGLPQPQYNVCIEDEVVDMVWPEQRLIVEVDGWKCSQRKAGVRQ